MWVIAKFPSSERTGAFGVVWWHGDRVLHWNTWSGSVSAAATFKTRKEAEARFRSAVGPIRKRVRAQRVSEAKAMELEQRVQALRRTMFRHDLDPRIEVSTWIDGVSAMVGFHSSRSVEELRRIEIIPGSPEWLFEVYDVTERPSGWSQIAVRVDRIYELPSKQEEVVW